VLFRSLTSIVDPSQPPPPQRLEPPSCGDLSKLVELPRLQLPTEAFADGAVLAFEPCSNLCIYNFGVAACLQRAVNFEEIRPRLRFAGTSSGALVAAFLALDADICSLFPKCVELLDGINTRRCGWVGVYSRTIRELVRTAGAGRDVRTALAGARLRIKVTEFAPLPSARELVEFNSQHELEQSVLASCYIPVVWEEPIWLPGIGPCLDGGAAGFLVNGDFVFGPYHSNLPDVGPVVEYVRQLVFQPVDEQDIIRLFEDGYRDCAAWIRQGCPSKSQERARKLFGAQSTALDNVKVLIAETAATFLEVAGIRNKRSV